MSFSRPTLGRSFPTHSIASADPRTAAAAAAAAVGSLTLGLIDANLLRRECLTRALDALQSRLTVHAFASIEDCAQAARGVLELLICQTQSVEDTDGEPWRHIRTVCASVEIPVIVLSDADEAQQAQAIRAVLKCGARGFIATRTTGLSMLLAALRFVAAGGTCAPLEFLFDGAPKGGPPLLPQVRSALTNHFTGRQSAVLGLLRQGKANKLIARELGMSESTVKVHVRNIMRVLGAANRTEVAYRLQDAYLSTGMAARVEN